MGFERIGCMDFLFGTMIVLQKNNAVICTIYIGDCVRDIERNLLICFDDEKGARL